MSSKGQENLSDVAMEKELLCIWRCALKNDNLTIDDDFFECGGDSLLATQLLLEIEQLTGKSFPPSIIFETGTVRQLLKIIMATDRFKPQVSFLMGSLNGKIIHFFHGDWEQGGVCVKTFSKMLGADYLIHAIAPHVPHEGKLPGSIEDMAKERLHKIIDKQPEGPYIILGQCNGALVGFEAARQLILIGKEVKAVVMIDPTIMSVRRTAQFIFITADFFMRLMGIQESKRRIRLIWIWKNLIVLDGHTKDIGRRTLLFFQKTWPQKRTSLKKIPRFISRCLYDQMPNFKSEESKKIAQHFYNVLFDYKPLSLNVPLLYISLQFGGYAWRRIARNTIYIDIYRGHHDFWNEDYSQDVVDKIREFINR